MYDDENGGDALNEWSVNVHAAMHSMCAHISLCCNLNHDHHGRMTEPIDDNEDELHNEVHQTALDDDVHGLPRRRLGRKCVQADVAGDPPDAPGDETRYKNVGAKREDEACEAEWDDGRRDLRRVGSEDEVSNDGGAN